MQPSRNFDDLKFSSIHRRILLWGSGGPFLDGYVLVMIGVALEQLTPALKLDADWIGLLGAGTLAGLFVGTSLFGYISDKVGRRKMFLIDIIAIGVTHDFSPSPHPCELCSFCINLEKSFWESALHF